MAEKNIKAAIESLLAKPNQRNWEKFASELKKSKVVYYKVFFTKGKLAKSSDLKNSYVGLFGSDSKLLYKVPLYRNDGKNLRGATIYLKGLLNLNA